MKTARTEPAEHPAHKSRAIDDRRWAAVLARDKSADGTFVLGVATTGIYCRPSCPARKPLRRNVRFFATSAEARADGFRACKRCAPDAAGNPDPNLAKVMEACRLIEKAESPLRLDELAKRAGMSPYHFHRVFKTATGVTPKAYADAHRQRRVRDALKGDSTVTEAIYASGFNSSGRFYAAAPGALGMKPSEFRTGAPNNEISYAAAPCLLGLVMVAATAKGVCSIMLADDERELMGELTRRFPKARLVPGNRDFAKLLARVIALIETPQKKAELPLDVRGTAFQHQVWMALRDIPAGTTITYAELARRIGKPNAVRAVGAACGANPVAVAIPCHRVVGKDGKLTGYRWGTARKSALLDRERGKR